MSGLLVEMLGLPGSGKTAVARETCAVLRAHGVPADVVDGPISAGVPRTSRVVRRTSASARAALGNPRWALSSGVQIASVQQPSGRDAASVLAQWLAVGALTARARSRGGVHLLEEGPRQTLWTMLLRSSDPLPSGLLGHMPDSLRCDTIVVLDVPVEVVERRLRRRASKHSRSQQLPPELLRAELRRGQDLIDVLATSTTTPVVRLNGSDETTAAELGHLLAAVLGMGELAESP